MTALTDEQRLKHALHSSELIFEAVATRGLKQVVEDDLLFAGIERHLGIIGEAINRLSDAFKDAHPELQWQKIVRFRNFLIHDTSQLILLLFWTLSTLSSRNW